MSKITSAMVNTIAKYWATKISTMTSAGIESIAMNATKTALVITYKDGGYKSDPYYI